MLLRQMAAVQVKFLQVLDLLLHLLLCAVSLESSVKKLFLAEKDRVKF